MRCVVPFCRNNSHNVSASEGKNKITFHGFPSDVQLRAAWLKALGKLDAHLPSTSVVCSQHFLEDEIKETESGIRQINIGAIPSTVQVCIICLDTDRKMILMSKHNLVEAYEKLMGHPMIELGNLKKTVCVLCAERLRNFRIFRAKSLRACSLMIDLVDKHEIITAQHINSINLAKKQLKYNFAQTTLGPDDSDSYILEPDEEIQIKTEENESRDFDVVVVKTEQDDDSVEDIVNEEFVANKEYLESDDSFLLDTSLSKALRRTLKASSSEAAVLKTGFGRQGSIKSSRDGDSKAGTSQDARAASASSSSVMSHIAENKQCKRKLNDDPSAELTPALVTATNDAATPIGSESSGHSNKGNKVKFKNAEDPPAEIPARFHDGQNIQTSSKDSSKQTASNYEDSGTHSKPIRSMISQSETECTDNDNDKEINSVPENSRNEKNRFTCAICCNTFNRKGILVKRAKTRTDMEKIKTQAIKELNRKFKDTGERSYICKFCKRKYSRTGSLANLTKTHRREKLFACKSCNYKSVSNCNLLVHMRKHTGEKPFNCNLCDHKFAQASALVIHMRTHTGEKPYCCNSCDYKTVTNSHLVVHMRTHTGEKPYNCDLCKYKSSRKYNLVDHIKTHTGEKRFCCELCGYKCANKSNLTRHMKTHNSKKQSE